MTSQVSKEDEQKLEESQFDGLHGLRQRSASFSTNEG